MKAENLPFADGEFDVATAIEVLEHVPDPAHTVAEMARVAAAATCSSPCRASRCGAALNMARGAYLQGPRQHARAREPLVQARVRRAAAPPRRGRRGALAVPVDDAARPALSRVRARSGYGRGARILSIGIALDRRRHVRVLLARLARARRRRLQADLAAVVGAVRDRLGDLPADRAAALAHDRRPPRPRLRARPPAAHAAADPGRLRARCSSSSRSALRGPIQDDLFDGSTALYWVLVVAVLAYAASYFARGWLAGHQWFGALRRARVPGGGLALPVRARGGGRDRRTGRPRWRSGMAAAPFVSLVVVPWAFSRRPPAPAREARRRRGARARPRRALRASPCWRSWSPSRRCSTPACCWSTRPRPTPRWPASCSTCC